MNDLKKALAEDAAAQNVLNTVERVEATKRGMAARGFSRTPSGRPTVMGVFAPLTESSPLPWWQEEAEKYGLSVDELKHLMKMADEMIENG